MRDWLLHMTESQRTYAVGLIDAALDRLGTPFDMPPVRCPNWTRLTVRSLGDRRAGASVLLSRGKVFLRTPLSLRRGRFAAEITGRACSAVDVLADGDVAVMLVTLAEWRSALSSPVTAATTAEVEKMEQALEPDTWDLEPGTCDLRLGTWYLGLGTSKLGPGT